MTHETTLAMAELKRELISANKTDAMRKHAGYLDTTVSNTLSPLGEGADSGPTWVVLGDGKFMDGVLYRRVKRDVLARIPDLPVGEFLQIKKICSPEFWACLESADRQRAGRCLAHLVSRKEVGLALASLSWAGPQLYYRT